MKIVNPYGGGGIEIVSEYYPAYGAIFGYHCNSSVAGAPSERAAFRLSGATASQIQLIGIRSNRSPAEVIYVSGAAHIVKVLPDRFNGWPFVASGRYMARTTDGATIEFVASPEIGSGNRLLYSQDATSWIILPNDYLKKTFTIASGVIPVSGRGQFQLETEGAAASDDLMTINGGKDGDIISLFTASSARDVVVKHGTGNIFLGADFTLTNNVSRVTLQNVAGIQWHRIASVAN